ncbi:hypothetical protein WICPIJ_007242 [Wickerhamomyces pijperi]|uniref:Presequence translocated-associated motor subunit PAM17 n=1 Tax=Wickerhamomyces pijperi TaxID=599730 RepID=A0A9P8Q0L9_WICPI|nr:hypothetical protein WICPIJ_007242 [Wickerhamomyces pijperi]
MFRIAIRSSLQRQLNTTPATTSLIRSFSKVSVLRQEEITSTTKADQITWVDFFKLRKQQRNINVGSSIATALIGSTISWSYISQVEIDPTQMIFGFDPFMIYFAGFLATSGVGYLFGPFLGEVIFNMKNSKQLPIFKAKQKLFLEKIKDKRVNPAFQSFNNPVPDYYGEKIHSLKSYKQWLRDNNAYTRKSQEFL